MKAEYINSFYQATNDVFKLMLNMETEKKNLSVLKDMISSRDVNVHLGITGDLKGNVLFGFPKDMAIEMIRIMSGMEMDKIDSFASSALGEIGNIIGGNALTNLSKNKYVCDIAPPQVFVGKYKSFSLDNEKILQLALKTDIGEFDISIFLKEK